MYIRSLTMQSVLVPSFQAGEHLERKLVSHLLQEKSHPLCMTKAINCQKYLTLYTRINE